MHCFPHTAYLTQLSLTSDRQYSWLCKATKTDCDFDTYTTNYVIRASDILKVRVIFDDGCCRLRKRICFFPWLYPDGEFLWLFLLEIFTHVIIDGKKKGIIRRINVGMSRMMCLLTLVLNNYEVQIPTINTSSFTIGSRRRILLKIWLSPI